MNEYYIDEKYIPVDTKTGKIVIGLDIPDEKFRGQGLGTEALELFICNFKNNNVNEIYLQTWTDNSRMMKVT